MTQKERDIEAFLKEPIKVGDRIYAKGMSSRDPEKYSYETVKQVDDTYVYFVPENYRELQKRKISEIRRDTSHIGVNPFQSEIRNTTYAIDIEQLFWRGGIERTDRSERVEKYFNVPIPEVNLNPIVIDKDGNETPYQRGLVWTLEQKQLLIESIYNNVEIGKFVFRKRSFKWVESRVKAGKIEHTAFSDLVDGKQRFTTLVEFVNNKFADLHGNYFSDLSDKTQRRFTNYRHLTYVELDEEATDEDTLAVFLAINFTGVPMSRDHIEYVKSIRIK